MKKFIIAFLLLSGCLATVSTASGRSKHVQFPDKKILRYQGEFSITGGVTSYNFNISVDFLNGIRWNPYLFTGIGLGIEGGVAELTAPIYANVRGYAPISKKVNMYLGTDIGIKHWIRYAISRFYAGPEFGFNFEFGRRMGMNVGVKYDIWCIPLSMNGVEVNKSLNTFGLVVGLVF